MTSPVLDALLARFGGTDRDAPVILGTSDRFGDAVATVAREGLLDVARFLRDDPAMAFDAPVLATATDWLGRREPRFEVVWQLRSTTLLHSVRLKVPVAEEDLVVPSLTPLWKGFNWQERECFDMYGVRFDGHPDLRRIYMYDEFVGHPLRKDYPKEKRQPLVRRAVEPHDRTRSR